jgi:hypothetical protein
MSNTDGHIEILSQGQKKWENLPERERGDQRKLNKKEEHKNKAKKWNTQNRREEDNRQKKGEFDSKNFRGSQMICTCQRRKQNHSMLKEYKI